MKGQKNRWKGFLLAIGAATLWGISGAFGQFLFEHRGINTEWLVSVRLLISGLILLTIAGARKDQAVNSIWKVRKDAIQLFLFSILGMLAVQYTFFAAIKHSNAATATVLQYSGPVLIALYLAIHNRRFPVPLESLAIILAVAGTFLLVTHGSFNSLSISGLALFWGLSSAVAMAYYSIQPGRLLKKYPSTVILGWAMVIGGMALSFTHAPWKTDGEWDLYTFLFLAFIILLGSFVAFYFYLTAIKLIGPQVTSLLASAEPLSAAIIAVVWLKVPFSNMDWLGSLFILSAIFLLTQRQKPKVAAV
ncbi:EamA family transporter [Flavitalea flava]